MKELSPYLECAMAVNTHGVKGALKLENRCDTPKVLASLKRMFIKKNGEEGNRFRRSMNIAMKATNIMSTVTEKAAAADMTTDMNITTKATNIMNTATEKAVVADMITDMNIAMKVTNIMSTAMNIIRKKAVLRVLAGYIF